MFRACWNIIRTLNFMYWILMCCFSVPSLIFRQDKKKKAEGKVAIHSLVALQSKICMLKELWNRYIKFSYCFPVQKFYSAIKLSLFVSTVCGFSSGSVLIDLMHKTCRGGVSRFLILSNLDVTIREQNMRDF